MGEIQVTDEWLYQYMPIVDEAILRELEKNTDRHYIFSHRFESRMKRLIRRRRHTFSRRAALLVPFTMGGIAAAALSVQAYRVQFFETCRRIWEDSALYSYFNVDAPGVEGFGKPGYVPAGFRLVSESANENIAIYIYEDGKGVGLSLSQQLVLEGKSIVFDTEYDQCELLDIDGIHAEIYRYDDGSVCAYYERGDCIYTINAEELSDEDIKEIFRQW